jgi:hypothetical protein
MYYFKWSVIIAAYFLKRNRRKTRFWNNKQEMFSWLFLFTILKLSWTSVKQDHTKSLLLAVVLNLLQSFSWIHAFLEVWNFSCETAEHTLKHTEHAASQRLNITGLLQWWPTHVPRHTNLPSNYFENAMNHKLCTVLRLTLKICRSLKRLATPGLMQYWATFFFHFLKNMPFWGFKILSHGIFSMLRCRNTLKHTECATTRSLITTGI